MKPREVRLQKGPRGLGLKKERKKKEINMILDTKFFLVFNVGNF